ncbi:MAG: type II secretion system protein [Cyanobacteria bacterium SIG32]|nr:type II secretion system protein [Cyanobacteria bacterium SIG32]
MCLVLTKLRILFSVGKTNRKGEVPNEVFTSIFTYRGGVERSPRLGFKGFTLAEVLITLAIIGVVAAMTIPTLIANYQQRSWDTASSVFNRRLGEALKIMNLDNKLTGHATTADFVDTLGNYIKIVKTCPSDKLTNCFVDEFNTADGAIDITELKEAKNLYSTDDYGTETIGVQFADGVSALIAYNPDATQDSNSNEVVKITGDRNSLGIKTDAISILYDVSGDKSPNSYGNGEDIRGLNISIKTGTDVLLLEGTYSWDDAIAECESRGMLLPELNVLKEVYNRREALKLPSEGRFYSKTEDAPYLIWTVHFDTGDQSTTDSSGWNSVVCVSSEFQ